MQIWEIHCGIYFIGTIKIHMNSSTWTLVWRRWTANHNHHPPIWVAVALHLQRKIRFDSCFSYTTNIALFERFVQRAWRLDASIRPNYAAESCKAAKKKLILVTKSAKEMSLIYDIRNKDERFQFSINKNRILVQLSYDKSDLVLAGSFLGEG